MAGKSHSVSEDLISSRQRLVLDLPPSCLAFCPARPDHFVVGTYYLDATGEPSSEQKTQGRHGSLVLFGLDANGVKEVHSLTRESAVLDLDFSPERDASDVCAVVDSTATLAVFQVHPEAAQPLQQRLSYRISKVEKDILFLACAWHPSSARLIAIATSRGDIYLVKLSTDFGAVDGVQGPILSHPLEAWCVAFIPQRSQDGEAEVNRFTLCSGADDSILQLVECELSILPSAETTAEFSVQVQGPPIRARGHTAGVTAILPLPQVLSDGAALLITGSYDEFLRVWTVQAAAEQSTSPHSRYKLQAESRLGGGVWRLTLVSLQHVGAQWHAVILASCMHAGVRLVEVTGALSGVSEGCMIRILGRFEEHQSMNYATGFQPYSGREGRLTCVSTSFYDRLLCLWEF